MLNGAPALGPQPAGQAQPANVSPWPFAGLRSAHAPPPTTPVARAASGLLASVTESHKPLSHWHFLDRPCQHGSMPGFSCLTKASSERPDQPRPVPCPSRPSAISLPFSPQTCSRIPALPNPRLQLWPPQGPVTWPLPQSPHWGLRRAFWEHQLLPAPTAPLPGPPAPLLFHQCPRQGFPKPALVPRILHLSTSLQVLPLATLSLSIPCVVTTAGLSVQRGSPLSLPPGHPLPGSTSPPPRCSGPNLGAVPMFLFLHLTHEWTPVVRNLPSSSSVCHGHAARPLGPWGSVLGLGLCRSAGVLHHCEPGPCTSVCTGPHSHAAGLPAWGNGPLPREPFSSLPGNTLWPGPSLSHPDAAVGVVPKHCVLPAPQPSCSLASMSLRSKAQLPAVATQPP